jgi:hypothetical protein
MRACTCVFSVVMIQVVYLGTLSTRVMRRGVMVARPPAVTKHTGRGPRFTGAAGESLALESGSSSAAASGVDCLKATTADEAAARARSATSSDEALCSTAFA